MHRGVKFDPSCKDLGMLYDTSLVNPKVVGLILDCALLDILHFKCLGKFVENVGCFSSFLDTLVKNPNDFILINQLMSLFSR